MFVQVILTIPCSELELNLGIFLDLSSWCLCDDEDDVDGNTCLDLELERDTEPMTGDFLRSLEMPPPVMVLRKLLRDLTWLSTTAVSCEIRKKSSIFSLLGGGSKCLKLPLAMFRSINCMRRNRTQEENFKQRPQGALLMQLGLEEELWGKRFCVKQRRSGWFL